MAIPIPAFRRSERLAMWILLITGVVCTALALTGALGSLGGTLGDTFQQPWFFADPGRIWLTTQSLLVLLGVMGYYGRSLVLTLVGASAALAIVTPVGVVCFLPGLWVVYELADSWRVFLIRQPQFPGSPDFEETIGERPALLIHARITDRPGKDRELFGALYTRLSTVDWGGAQFLGAQCESDLGEWAFYICAKELGGPGPEELLAAIGPVLCEEFGTVEWRAEKRYAAPSESLDKMDIAADRRDMS